MRVEFPVTLGEENDKIIHSNSEPIRFGANLSGYDRLGRRVTNIVGFDGTHLIKECPKCGSEKTSIEFGLSGRTMENGEVRDQSNCTRCRAHYSRIV